jgi:hypothetical protein
MHSTLIIQGRFLQARKPMTFSYVARSDSFFPASKFQESLVFIPKTQIHRFYAKVGGKVIARFFLCKIRSNATKKRTKMRPKCETSETGTRVLQSKFKKFKRE